MTFLERLVESLKQERPEAFVKIARHEQKELFNELKVIFESYPFVVGTPGDGDYVSSILPSERYEDMWTSEYPIISTVHSRYHDIKHYLEIKTDLRGSQGVVSNIKSFNIFYKKYQHISITKVKKYYNSFQLEINNSSFWKDENNWK